MNQRVTYRLQVEAPTLQSRKEASFLSLWLGWLQETANLHLQPGEAKVLVVDYRRVINGGNENHTIVLSGEESYVLVAQDMLDSYLETYNQRLRRI